MIESYSVVNDIGSLLLPVLVLNLPRALTGGNAILVCLWNIEAGINVASVSSVSGIKLLIRPAKMVFK